MGLVFLRRLDREFFLAVQDAVAGAFDDDGDRLADVARPSLMGCPLTMIRPLAWTPSADGDRAREQRRQGQRVVAAWASVIPAGRPW